MLRSADLKLQDAESICRAAEATKAQMKGLQDNVDVIKKNPREYGTGKWKMNFNKNKHSHGMAYSNNAYNCLKCATKHVAGACPAFGKTCNLCGVKNHYAVGCKNRSRDNVYKGKSKKTETGKSNVHAVSSNEAGDEDETDVYIDQIMLSSIENQWIEKVIIDNKPVPFKLDTGAQCNVLPLYWVRKLNISFVETGGSTNNNHRSILTYGNNKINILGYLILKCVVRNECTNIKFTIVDVDSQPVLGLNACIKLNLVKKIDAVDHLTNNNNMHGKQTFINNNIDLFTGTGKIPYYIYKIILKKDAVPFASPCRRIPDAIRNKVKAELDSLRHNC